VFNTNTYSCWEISIQFEGDSNIRVKHTDWIRTLSILGFVIKWDSINEREIDCWKHNTKKTKGIHWETITRVDSLILGEHESQSMVIALDSCI